MSIPDSLLSVSRSDLAAEKQADPTLSELFEMVLSDVEMKSAVKGYFFRTGCW